MKGDSPKALLSELVNAKRLGYIVRLDGVLSIDFGMVNYDEGGAVFRTDWLASGEMDQKISITQESATTIVDSLPPFREIHITFAESVTEEVVRKISQHIGSKYTCNTAIYKCSPLRLDLWGF